MTPVALLVLLVSVVLRCAGILRPLLGNFAMYQATNAMMAKFFVDSHFATLLYPQVNVLVEGKPGLLLLAYPVNALVAAVFYSIFDFSLDFWGRFQAVMFFALTAVTLYRLTKRLWDEKIALASMIVFCLLPLTIIYGQSFQNEMATAFFSVYFFFAFVRYLDKNRAIDLLLAAFSMSMVLITRPNCLYLGLPVLYLIYLLKKSTHQDKPVWKPAILVGLLSAVIPALWYYHIWLVSANETNIYSTLFAQLMVRSSFASPLVLSVDYYTQLFDVISGITLTPIGFTLFLIGAYLAVSKGKAGGFYLIWALAFLVSSMAIPRKLLDHNFYLLHLSLPAAPVIAKGYLFVLNEIKARRKLFIVISTIAAFALSMRYALNPSFKTTAEDANLLHVAEKVKEFTVKDTDRVIVQGTHTLLYYADRYGWAISIDRGDDVSDYYTKMNWQQLKDEEWNERNEAFKSSVGALEYLIRRKGATHFVASYVPQIKEGSALMRHLREHYQVLYEEEGSMAVFGLS